MATAGVSGRRRTILYKKPLAFFHWTHCMRFVYNLSAWELVEHAAAVMHGRSRTAVLMDDGGEAERL